MKGELERIEGGVLVGWALDEARPERPVQFDLMVNEAKVGSFVADVERPDLSAPCGFEVEIRREWLQPGKNSVSAWSQPGGRLIGRPLSTRKKGKPAAPPELTPKSTSGIAAPAPALPPPVPDSPDVAAAPRVAVEYVKRPAPSSVVPTTIDVEGLTIALDAIYSESGDPVPMLETIVERLFRRRRWNEVVVVCEHFRTGVWDAHRLLGWYGRALLSSREPHAAAKALARMRELRPERHADIFYLGLAFARTGRHHEALEVFESGIAHDPGKAKYFHEAGRVLVQIGFGAYGLRPEDRSALDRAVEHFETALSLEKRDWRYYRELSGLELGLGREDRALELAEAAIAASPAEHRAYTELAKVYVRLNRIPEALAAAQRGLALNPANDTSKFNVRLISRLGQSGEARAEPTTANLTLPQPATAETLRSAVAAEDADWLTWDGPTALPDARSLVARFGFPWAAGIRVSPDADPAVWRRSFLEALLASGRLPPESDVSTVTRVAAGQGQIVVAEPDPHSQMRRSLPAGGTVLLFSQYGIRRFGGGEHFLQQMAHLYRRLGFDPVVVGTEAGHAGEYGEDDGLRYVFVERTPEAILRLALEERAVLAHVISGLAYDVTTSLRTFDVRVIYGVHSWRDMYTPPTAHDGYFPDIDRGGARRPEFDVVLQDAAAVYANADFSRGEIERLYGVRSPVIYSLPDDLGALSTRPRDYVLLANSRSEKGFDLVLDVASRLPDRRFVAISSQSSRDAAEALVSSRGIPNVEIVDRVEDMRPLYEGARVVAVPSYRFIETFSRVVIEAHRFGTPVIGSDRGNVPYLLEQSGIALPEDADRWAEEVERLFCDEEEWQRRSELALENSERYAFRHQEAALSRVVSGVAAPMLVGIGSGLGNIIHTTPLLRNLSLRLGRRLDVVVAGDHEALLFIPANREYVNHTFLLGDNVLNRRYDTVFLTNSFGSLVPRFASSNVVSSRSWDSFHAGHELHEAEFNLAAAQALLGVPYDAEDIGSYFIGDVQHDPRDRVLVGMHAGSKGGIWGSKRWPHYPELARRLQRDGYDVASFGVAEEHVEGTIDMTGGSIEEMTARLAACTHFVANDSGVMNIANALGIPVAAIFAPTNPVTRGPVTTTGSSISIERSCAPCEVKMRSRFLSGECSCIDAIDVDTVYGSVLGMLRAPVAL